jgi:hypothetical protein
MRIHIDIEHHTINQSLYLRPEIKKITADIAKIITVGSTVLSEWIFWNEEFLPNFGGYTLN